MMTDVNRKHSITLTEDEYNLIVYCIEQQMIEFNKEEYEDSSSIINKLSQITEIEDKSYDVESCIISGEDYSDCIDKLVESMVNDNPTIH